MNILVVAMQSLGSDTVLYIPTLYQWKPISKILNDEGLVADKQAGRHAVYPGLHSTLQPH